MVCSEHFHKVNEGNKGKPGFQITSGDPQPYVVNYNLGREFEMDFSRAY